jgi:hypothetical protein
MTPIRGEPVPVEGPRSHATLLRRKTAPPTETLTPAKSDAHPPTQALSLNMAMVAAVTPVLGLG